MPSPGEHSSSKSTQGLGSKKNSFVGWPDLKFDQDIHTYWSKWEVRKHQLVSLTYFDSLQTTTTYFLTCN